MFQPLGPRQIRPSCCATKAVSVARRDKCRSRPVLPRFRRARHRPSSTAISKPTSKYPFFQFPRAQWQKRNLPPPARASRRRGREPMLFRSSRSALRRISSRQLRCPARQVRSRRNPLNRGWPHHQKRHLQEQPVQPGCSSHCKNRDESQGRKFQHGDHDVPPV